MNVGSVIELYTTVMGWQFYQNFWDMFTGTGLAFIPFIVAIVKNFAEGYRGRPGDGAEQSVRAMELDVFVMMTVIVLAAQPTLDFNPSVLEFKPACTASGAPGTVTRTFGNTGSTYDDTLVSGVSSGKAGKAGAARIPIWWMGVMAISGGATRAMTATLPCAPDLRRVSRAMKTVAIKDPATRAEYNQFRNECWQAASSKHKKHPNAINEDNRATDLAETYEFENDVASAWINTDLNYAGSRIFLNVPGYYDTLKPPNIPESMAGSDPTCKEWWEGGLQDRLSAETSKLETLASDIVNNVSVVDSMKKLVPWNWNTLSFDDDIGIMALEKNGPATMTGTGFTGSSNVPVAAAGGAAAAGVAIDAALVAGSPAGAVLALGGASLVTSVIGKGIDFYVMMYLVREAMPFVQAFILMAIYAFLPALLVFSGFRMMPVLTASIGIFAVKFWTVLWFWVAWLDANLLASIYGSPGEFATQGTWLEGIILDVVTMSLYLGLPILFTVVIGWGGANIGRGVSSFLTSSTGGASGGAKGVGSKATGAATSAGKSVRK